MHEQGIMGFTTTNEEEIITTHSKGPTTFYHNLGHRGLEAEPTWQ